MAKYSVSSSSSHVQNGCELCGSGTDDLETIEVEGARIQACPECRVHNDMPEQSTNEPSSRDTTTASQTTVSGDDVTSDLWDSDTDAWERDGAGYDSDILPHLHHNYGQAVTDARTARDMSIDGLAEAIDVESETVRSIEQEQAYSDDIGGSVIAKLESFLDITISDQ